MSKAKKKRVHKDLDKLWRTGKYKEWVHLVGQTDQLNFYQAQWQEAWRYLCRQALRRPGQLEEFWQLLAAQPQAPDVPDVVFLRGLKDFLARGENISEINALAGLSPPAQMLREKLRSWSPEAIPNRKISRLLNTLVQQPDKVSGKLFNDLAELVHPNPLSASLLSLGKTINRIRKLNHRGGFNPHLLDMRQTALNNADNLLAQLAQPWDQITRSVLLYPFCHQLWKCLQGLWEKADFDSVAYLTTFLPFLCSQTFGPEAAKLQAYSRQHSEEFYSDADQQALMEKSWSQGLDAMALALGQARRFLKSGLVHPSSRFLARFRTTYLRFLKEIALSQDAMNSREKSDLIRVLDPILFEDRFWLEDDDRFMEDILKLAFAAGVAGARISLLVLLNPELAMLPTLKRPALEILRQLPYPGERLIEEMLLDPQMLPFPEIGHLNLLFNLYPEESELRQLIADNILNSLNVLLLTSAITITYETRKRDQKEMLLAFRRSMQIFSHSLARLQEYAEFAPLQDIVVCFPEGYYTSEGYQLLLQKLYDRSHNFEQFLAQIDRYSNIADLVNLIDSPFIKFFSSRWVESQATQFWQFIIDHLADLENVPLDSLRQLVDRALSGENVSQLETNFLQRLTNLLHKRQDAGETAAETLSDEILQALISLSKTGSHRRPRK